ncbi:UNVERIFIED_CONTAM: hypothetical protein RMT77_011280 [Armadillidium vulgare]
MKSRIFLSILYCCVIEHYKYRVRAKEKILEPQFDKTLFSLFKNSPIFQNLSTQNEITELASFLALSDDFNSTESKERKKRTIRLFPKGSHLQTKWNINIPVKNVTMYKTTYNFDLYCPLTFPAFFQAFETRKRRRRRRNDQFDPEEELNIKRTKQSEKIGIFKQIQNLFQSFGWPAKECLLRFLCELYEKPFMGGIFGDAIDLLFRPSLDPKEIEEDYLEDWILEEYKEFLEAEKHGKVYGQCHNKYPQCHISIFDIFPMLDISTF